MVSSLAKLLSQHKHSLLIWFSYCVKSVIVKAIRELVLGVGEADQAFVNWPVSMAELAK